VPALRALARRSTMQVDAKADDVRRLAPYFIGAEATANAVKHSNADHVEISVAYAADTLRVTVTDNGVGGATFAAGTGLQGVRDRAEAAGVT
jgi:signal transduction histidine kinase